MAMIKAAETSKLVFLALVLAVALSAVSCATGPLGSHGVDYIPAFDTPDQNGGG
jgi:hypothetical protein